MKASNGTEVNVSHHKFEYWLVFVFACLSLIGVLHHEMWRDELQAWTLARDSSSLADLWRNMRTEPHPMLWHTLLWVLTRYTRNPVAMQYLHWLIAVASVYVFVRCSPFTILQKTLFCFGYYPLFEYCMIARNYSLCMPLLFSFCWLMQRQPRSYLAFGWVIGLMCCTHVYDWPLAAASFVVLTWSFISSPMERQQVRRHWRKVVTAGSILTLWALVAGTQMFGYSRQMQIRHQAPPSLHLNRITEPLTGVWRGLIPIPRSGSEMSFWNSNLLADDGSLTGRGLALFLSSSLVVLLSALFWWWSRRAFLMYSLGTLSLLALQVGTGIGSMRHNGRHWLLLLASCWLALDESPAPHFTRLAAFWKRHGAHLFGDLITFILAAHVLAGGIFYWGDIRLPFSTAKATVQFLADNRLTDKPVIVSHDAWATSISGYLGRKVYAVDSGRMHSFLPCDSAYYAHINRPTKEILPEIFHMLSDATNQVILITSYHITMEENGKVQDLQKWEHANTRITHLTEFNRALSDEQFTVYLVERVAGLPVVSYAGTYNNLGIALLREGNVQGSLARFEQALKLSPGSTEVQNNLAWVLATRSPAEGGEPVRAVTLAERACELTGSQVPAYLDTLGAAYATAGRFDEAIASAQKAIELARSAGQRQLVEEIQTRLELYRSGKAYREAIPVTIPSQP